VEELKAYALTTPNRAIPTRGVCSAVITYHSRDEDPRSRVPSRILSLPSITSGGCRASIRRIVVSGCSGGGDLALEIAAATDVAAIAPEEPATVLFTGVLNTDLPKKGERYTPEDSAPISADPKRYYTAKYQILAREKIGKIRSPILIIQGDQTPINRFNAEVLIPELRTAGKATEIITCWATHCFAFWQRASAPRPAAALKAFQDGHVFPSASQNEASRSTLGSSARTDHSAIGFSHGLTGAGADGGEQRRNPRHLAPPRSAPRR
jgi:hypothetical protein